ncbi:MAG TPA: recombination mediator RecR [Ignavibacteriaceae bacterium]|nr:recombination mediator RecR [Ignavibacteriaceae bacterium]
MQLPGPLQVLVEELNKLPSVGRKTALRLSLYLLKKDKESVNNLVKSIIDLKEKIRTCSKCYNIAEDEYCAICNSHKRDKKIICVVEEASDVIAIEKTNEYNGLYHVLEGVLSPLSGVSSDAIRIRELLKRLEQEEISEVILALNPDTEGETTSLYIAKLVKPLGIKVSRIARGLPIGGDLEFADEATIGRAVNSRILL